MLIRNIILFFAILFSCIVFGQNDTIYSVIPFSKEESFYYYRKGEKHKIQFLDGMDEWLKQKCSYVKNNNLVCLFSGMMNGDKVKYYRQSNNFENFSGILEDSSPNQMGIVSYVKIKRGIEVEKQDYDSLNNLIRYQKFKYRKIEKGYIDRTRISNPYIEYYANGKIKLRGKKRDHLFFGTYREFYENGLLKMTCKYDKNGNRECKNALPH